LDYRKELTTSRINRRELFIRSFSFTRRNNFFVILFFIFIFSFFSCARDESSRIELALGTVCSVTLYENGKDIVFDKIFSRINEIENLMSVNINSSDISRINGNAGLTPVQVHEDTYKVIKRALYFAEISNGAFDPAVGPLVALWGISGDNPSVPSHEKIIETLPLVNWRNVIMDNQEQSVFLTRTGMALDLGAIAKGFAADETAKIIKNEGIARAKIDLGGNIIMLGEKKDKSPWRVGIQNPGGSRGSIIGILRIPEKTVVTSGVYERYFEENGAHYHHLFSPSLGYPVQNGLLSVTIITGVSTDADALSTAVFVLGYEKGISLLESFPEAQAVFVFEDNSVSVTGGIDFMLTDKLFYIK